MPSAKKPAAPKSKPPAQAMAKDTQLAAFREDPTGQPLTLIRAIAQHRHWAREKGDVA